MLVMNKTKKIDAENFRHIGLPPLITVLHPIVDVDRLWIKVLIPRHKVCRCRSFYSTNQSEIILV